MTSGGPPDDDVPDPLPIPPGYLPAVPPGGSRLVVLGALSVGAAAALVVVVSLIPGTGETLSRVWPVIFGLIFPVFAAGLLTFVATFPEARRRGSPVRTRPDPWRIMATWLPRPAVTALKVLVALAVLNFALFASTIGGQPEEHGGRYHTDNHGDLTQITATQYDQALRTGARGFSGHAVVFSAIGAAMLLASSRRRWSERAQDTPPGHR